MVESECTETRREDVPLSCSFGTKRATDQEQQLTKQYQSFCLTKCLLLRKKRDIPALEQEDAGPGEVGEANAAKQMKGECAIRSTQRKVV
jgi:hypothetical protein